jgi:hypothetical protein
VMKDLQPSLENLAHHCQDPTQLICVNFNHFKFLQIQIICFWLMLPIEPF